MSSVLVAWSPYSVKCSHCWTLFLWNAKDLYFRKGCYWVRCPECRAEEVINRDEIPPMVQDRAKKVE